MIWLDLHVYLFYFQFLLSDALMCHQIGCHGANFETPKYLPFYKVRTRLALGIVLKLVLEGHCYFCVVAHS